VSGVRGALLAGLVLVAVALQVAVLRYVSIEGVVPDLVLLLVVAAGLSRGPEYGAALGFGAGILLDVAPPADHVAGRWALALVVAGYLAGRVRADARSSLPAALLAVAACSFVAGSVYGLTGVVVGDDRLATGHMLGVIVIGVVWNVLVAPLVLPLARSLLGRLQPAGTA
jgi:rod shape-determining protein MreD